MLPASDSLPAIIIINDKRKQDLDATAQAVKTAGKDNPAQAQLAIMEFDIQNKLNDKIEQSITSAPVNTATTVMR